jgi:hypothetical protein
MPLARVAEQFDSGDSSEALLVVVPEALPVETETIAGLRATIAALNARIAELELPPERWAPLKSAAYDCGVEYETARSWAVSGLITARRERGRWFVDVSSLQARLLRLAAPRAK